MTNNSNSSQLPEFGNTEILSMTTDIVAAYVSNNQVEINDLTKIIKQVFNALAEVCGKRPTLSERPEPADELRVAAVHARIGRMPTHLLELRDALGECQQRDQAQRDLPVGRAQDCLPVLELERLEWSVVKPFRSQYRPWPALLVYHDASRTVAAASG